MDGENDPLNLHSEEPSVDRFRKIREELEAMELPDLPGEDELHERMPLIAKSSVREPLPDVPHVTINRRNPALNTGDDKNGQRSLGRGIAAGYSVIASVAGFGFLGWLINHPVGGAIGAGIGAVAGLAFAVYLLSRD